MCSVMGPCPAGWAEPLPNDCPPKIARDTKGEALFRLVRNNPPQAADYWSAFKLGRILTPPCKAKALSAWRTRESARALLRTPTRRNKGYRVAVVTFPLGGGCYTETPATGHVSVWHCGAVDLTQHSQVID